MQLTYTQNVVIFNNSSQLARKIKNDVLEQMYCRGKKVETLVEEQIAEETYKEAAWVEPVIIAVPIAFVFLVAVGTFVGKFA